MTLLPDADVARIANGRGSIADAMAELAHARALLRHLAPDVDQAELTAEDRRYLDQLGGGE